MQLEKLEQISRRARADILRMTKIANSGHPGGSMSSIDLLLAVYSFARIDPSDPYRPDRDRVVVSHGHVSPAVYTALAHLGFHDIDEVIATFRLAGSKFEGHIERHVEGVEWTTGNLGQGLSAGCGFALASKLLGRKFNVFVVMSDAEQAKGQVAEARRFAVKYGLNNITVVVDYNHLQISGRVEKVMPVNIKENYLADGWDVLEVDGHDFSQLLAALEKAARSEKPVCILATTVMGKGVSFMENDPEYHGRALTDEEFARAMAELGFDTDLTKWVRMRKEFVAAEKHPIHHEIPEVRKGSPVVYTPDVKTDNRSAFGRALLELGKENIPAGVPIAAFDCDLAGSVKVKSFASEFPENFFEAGVSEHNTAATAGALSSQGVVTFFADFGVFGIDEVYNQLRLNDINETNLKVAVTHCGIDVGEDGKTHHCLDYVGAARNLYGFRVIVPADPNQTDRAVRYAASTFGNFIIVMGRSKTPVITDEDGNPYYDENYQYRYGEADIIRKGSDAALFCMGSTVHRAVQVHQILQEKGIHVAVINAHSPLNIPLEVIKQAAKNGIIFTYEDHNVNTGLGAEVSQLVAAEGLGARVVSFGVRDYAPSGSANDLYRVLGLAPEQIAEKIAEQLGRKQ